MNDLTKQFKWKDRNGSFHTIKDMSTKHLFFTVRMVWNHVVPDKMKILPYKRYKFGSFYSPEYLATAVRLMIIELSTREDLTPYFLSCLKLMKDYVDGAYITYEN